MQSNSPSALWIPNPQPDAEKPYTLIKNPTPEHLKSEVSYETNQEIPPEGYSDMVQMPVLNEPEILNNLRLRYSKDLIFTYIGPSLLVINPYKSLAEQYSESKLLEIREKKDNTLPHIYSLTQGSINLLETNQKNQAIVITGESGAGKTESTKHCMRFLTHEAAKNTVKKPISQKILDCNPILEAFGNAKTVRNDNSSRFGKYVRLLLQRNVGFQVHGATITSYLLEKSRVIEQAANERNFHIFYYLLASRSSFVSAKAEDFLYLSKSQCFAAKGIDYFQGFEEVVRSFKELGFSSSEIQEIWQILIAVLYIGNLEFSQEKLTDTTPCSVKMQDLFENIAKLLGVSTQELEKALVFKVREVIRQKILSPLSLQECEALKNSLAKSLYEKLFLWLVKKLNLTVFPEEFRKDPQNMTLRTVRKSIKIIRNSVFAGENQRLSIGLLDIFGFENFESNSFEQLCINFTNEKLQQLYISYIYKAEEAEMKAQGLNPLGLSFQDNQPVLDLIEKYPLSILDLLDESTALSSSNDETLLISLQKSLANPNNLFKTLKNQAFVIVHTAKPVVYQIQGFRSKNRDELNKETEELLKQSANSVVKDAFFEENQLFVKNKKFLAGKFKGQIKDLMNELGSCDVSFIRCLKPNEEKKADFFQESFVLLQIRYLGLLDSIKVRQNGYSVRRNYQEFYQKYRDLFPVCAKNKYLSNEAIKEICQEFFEKTLQENGVIIKKKDEVLLGKSKIFMKTGVVKLVDALLKVALRKKEENAKKILKQYNIYRFKKRLKFGVKALRLVFKAIIKLQSKRKAIKARRCFLQKKKAVALIKKLIVRQTLKKNLQIFKEKGNIALSIRKKTRSLIKLLDFQKKRLQKHYFLLYVAKALISRRITKKKTVRFSIAPTKQLTIEERICEKESRKSLTNSEEIKESTNSFGLGSFSYIAQSINLEDLATNPLKPEKKAMENEDFTKKPEANTPFQKLNQQLSYHFDTQFSNRESLLVSSFAEIPKSVDCYLDFEELDQELLNNIKNTEFLVNAAKLLQPQKKFFRLLPAERVLSYQKELTKRSLQKLKEELSNASQKIFKFILQYCYDRVCRSTLMLQVQKLLGLVIAKPLEPELVDETYLLLIKQIRNNNNVNNRLRVYKLLGLVSSVRSPSIRLYFAVLNFLYSRAISEEFNREELECIKFSMSKLIDGFSKGPRTVVPSENEIMLVEYRKMIQVPINFTNGGCLVLNIEPYTTIREVIEQILFRLEKSQYYEYFGLYEMLWVNGVLINEEYLEADAFIMDRVSSLERLKKKDHISKHRLKFFIRVRLFYKFHEQDLDSLDFLYSQFFVDIAQARLFVEENLLFQLIGVAMCVDYGQFDMEKSGKLTLNLERYVPAEKILALGPKTCFEKIMLNYSKATFSHNVNALKLRFLRLLQENEVFFAHHFEVLYAKVKNLSEAESVKSKKDKAFLGIKPLILEIWAEKLEKTRYEFNKILKWGRLDDKNLIIYTNDEEIHMFTGPKVKEIEYLIKNYVRIAIQLSGIEKE